ncbi:MULTISPECIES: hypothetical protein [Pseudomonas]|uniref:hypothetical protein n=1 Tax=Pseudomonas TaxID=286 RepID=UPI00138F850E|nr:MULTISPECIES: hypothetical protein [Pseudomonas]MBS9759840.1 hypothetical protein [Pseudomonas mosselii]
MYRNQAEQMAKNFIDVSLEQLGEEMRVMIQQEEVLACVRRLEPTLGGKIESLKQTWGGIIFNHFLGGLFSSLVAVGIFTFVSAYNKYQAEGGLEGKVKQQQETVAGSSQNSTSTLPAKPDISQ